ncbi:MaoC family dehydratase [Celeribacter marinus]|uniref:MaoC family dehydratase n=1 Tax=Celeribacter marinus TaxID=1397108 RepID=UPI003F6D8D76
MSHIDIAYAAIQDSIGTEIGVSDWQTIDQKMIDKFGSVTLDRQFIHNDPIRAATETPFGGTIAHGFLVLSLASRFAFDSFPATQGQVMGMNYGFDKVRFLTPVPCGARVRGRFIAKDVVRKSDMQLLQTSALTVEIEGAAKPALIADWLTLAVFS